MRCGGSVNALNVYHHSSPSLSSRCSLDLLLVITFRYPWLGKVQGRVTSLCAADKDMNKMNFCVSLQSHKITVYTFTLL